MRICNHTGIILSDRDVELDRLAGEGRVFDSFEKIEVVEGSDHKKDDGFVTNGNSIRKIFDRSDNTLIMADGTKIQVDVKNNDNLDFLLSQKNDRQ